MEVQGLDYILIPDHSYAIYGVESLIQDFCKKNHLRYYVYSLKKLKDSFQKNQLEEKNIYHIIKKNIIILFIIPVSISVGIRLYKLLDQKVISFATPSTGLDHVDFSFLKNKKLFFFDAQGENKDSVVEYVLSSLPYVFPVERLKHKEIQWGIIGYGRIGSLLATYLTNLGFSWVAYDPFVFPETYQKDWEQLKNCDVITFHVPLTGEGQFPTMDMISIPFLQQLNPQAVIINTSRGKIFSKDSYLYTIRNFSSVMDVYYQEPPQAYMLDSSLLKVATPHTAGYHWRSRFRGVFRILEKFAKQFNFDFPYSIDDFKPEKFDTGIFDSIVYETSSLKQNRQFFFIRDRYPVRAGIREQFYNPKWNIFYKHLYEFFQMIDQKD